YLGVTSCYVIEVNPAAGLAFVRESWEGWRNAGPSIVGEYHICDFVTPECLDEFEAGRATVVKDVMNDPRIRDFASKYKSLGVGAFISIPALNERQWEANLTVDHPQARDWRPDETQLMRDITARLWPAYKRARAVEALRESEERYRSVVESQTELICRFLPDTTLTFVNAPYCRYFDKTQEELIGTKFLELIPESAREATREHIESLIENPRVEINEHQVLLPGGRIGWQQWADHAILDASGRIVEFQAVGRDITERKQIEEAQRESEDRLRLALEAGRMGVWEWDTRTNAVKWSKEHYTVMGLMPFSVEPDYHTWADRVHPDDLPVASEQMRKAIEEKGEYCCEYRVIWPDGSVRWAEGRGKPVFDESGQCLKMSGLIVDITQRKQAEEALRESEEALRKSYSRIEDLAGRLITSQEEERRHIARELHDDLNQQVAALAIGISRLKRQFPDAGAAVREQIVKLRNKTDMLSERIRQVSHELHSSVLQHVGLPAALNSYCAEFSDREGIAVALDIGDGVEGVPPEAALCLYRVAQESLRNVARHSGARRAVVTLARANGAVELRVADQGVGFDPGQAHECRGLGLVSMEERVKLLHGRFVLTTGPGAGTELRAQIPLRGDHEQTTGIVG
ncbi:MAG TPA: PAS domain S-box protein, partial [Blastocatellia bacterium]|nr:PAS domain S-box protein [Blastocatellia bacterium]